VQSIQDVTAAGVVDIRAPCILEDQGAPQEGFNNRYRVLITTDKQISLPVIADYVKVQHLSQGKMKISSILWGSVTITPESQWIKDVIASSAPVFEIRPQNLMLHMLDDHTVEISFVEYWEDLAQQKYGSDSWELRHRTSIMLLGKAK